MLNLIERIDLIKDKYIALPSLSIYYIWKRIKSSYKNNRFKILVLIWHEEFALPDGSYSISDVTDYFEYILKSIRKRQLILHKWYTQKKIENRITFKIRTRYYLELLTPETIQLLGSTNKNSENAPNLKLTEVVLIQCNNFNNNYQQKSRVL